jgi:hypothetical protein
MLSWCFEHLRQQTIQIGTHSIAMTAVDWTLQQESTFQSRQKDEDCKEDDGTTSLAKQLRCCSAKGGQQYRRRNISFSGLGAHHGNVSI